MTIQEIFALIVENHHRHISLLYPIWNQLHACHVGHYVSSPTLNPAIIEYRVRADIHLPYGDIQSISPRELSIDMVKYDLCFVNKLNIEKQLDIAIIEINNMMPQLRIDNGIDSTFHLASQHRLPKSPTHYIYKRMVFCEHQDKKGFTYDATLTFVNHAGQDKEVVLNIT
jgi:hypothetical protein